jgi:D-alanyl-lipoteichoic acid acyltransferase DltB (MBOAT superfamily)
VILYSEILPDTAEWKIYLQFNGYTLQIYCDFSGYSDIAIGIAKLLGYQLGDNFKRPYQSKNITEFWRKWHISLSFWLRDYVYIPMGGNRKGVAKQYLFLMLTMLIGGLWHGASWKFVFWGGMHGVGLAMHKYFSHNVKGKFLKQKIWGVFSLFFTFNFVAFLWIFFRAADFATLANDKFDNI